MRTVTFLLVPLFLLACDPAPVAPDITPSFNIANAPDVSGIVVRGDNLIAVTWIDPKAGWRVIIGADILEFCGGTINFDVIPFQVAILQDNRLVRIRQGTDLQTSVWPFLPFSCGLFTTLTPLASGVSDLVETDNDLAVTGKHNQNAFGFQAHGILTRPSDVAAAFSAHFRAQFDLVSFTRFLSRKISLH